MGGNDQKLGKLRENDFDNSVRTLQMLLHGEVHFRLKGVQLVCWIVFLRQLINFEWCNCSGCVNIRCSSICSFQLESFPKYILCFLISLRTGWTVYMEKYKARGTDV